MPTESVYSCVPISFRLLLLLLILGGSVPSLAVEPQEEMPIWKKTFLESQARDAGEESGAVEVLHRDECIGGMAGVYPCNRVDLLEFLPLANIGGGSGNDIWGWTDPVTGREWALMGRTNGTAFIDISDPENPEYIANLPTQTGNSTWRDIKTRGDYAFIVSEASGHGIQVFDLTQLRSVATPPATFTATAHYSGFGSAHNIVVNEDSGFAYGVGTGDCGGGLHMVDISDPLNPTMAGCFSADGYTHDAQCVNYAGPDTDYAGQEICLNSNTDTLTIVDVTDKSNPVQVSRNPYSGRGYTHQGWLTEDHQYFLINDELDEINFGHNTKTYIWDVRDLDSPSVIGTFLSSTAASDHNLYIHDGFVYQANYKAGLRILSLDNVASGMLTEVAYFDTFPANDTNGTSSAWSVYPFFASGNVVVSTIGEGLFVVQPILCSTPAAPDSLSATAAGDNRIDLSWNSTAPAGATFDVYRSFGSCPGGGYERVATGIAGTSYSDTTASGQVEYSYVVRASVEGGLCVSPDSNCSATTTTGPCIAPPAFSGLQTLENPGSSSCALDLGWNAAAPNCGASATYSVYRDTTSGFTPSAANRVASGLSGLTFRDSTVADGQDYFYVVRSTDSDNGVEDLNTLELVEKPTGPITDGPYDLGAEVGDPAVIYGTGASLGGGEAGAPEHLGWEFSTARFNSGDRSYFSTYVENECLWFATPPITLTPGESSVLSFWTVYEIEDQWDGGVVQVTTDGGGSWSTLTLDQGYPGTFRSSSDGCGFNAGDPSFTGTNLTWSEFTADLSVFSGAEIQIRWIFSTDGAVEEEGWYVDDVQVTHVGVPGSCSGTAMFADGFESGDTSAWSAVLP